MQVRILSPDEIREVKDLTTKAVLVPEWGEGAGVYVRRLSVAEREELESSVVPTRDGRVNTKGFRTNVVIAAAVDEHGVRLFSQQDATWLSGKSAAAIERIAEAALEENGMTDSAADKAAGNSGGEPPADSSIGSPPPSAILWPTSGTGSTPPS